MKKIDIYSLDIAEELGEDWFSWCEIESLREALRGLKSMQVTHPNRVFRVRLAGKTIYF